MTFEEWWEDYVMSARYGLTTEDLKASYKAGWDACRDKWSGMTYEETLEYERDSI